MSIFDVLDKKSCAVSKACNTSVKIHVGRVIPNYLNYPRGSVKIVSL